MDVLTKPAVTIRQVEFADLPALYPCLVAMRKSSGYRIIPTQDDPFEALYWVYRQMQDERSCLLVAVEDDKIVGLCGGSVTDFHMLADFPHLWEWAWWSEEPRIAASLWRHLKSWAKARGAKGCVYGKSQATSETTCEETLYWRVW